jgi:hypothetical protein
LVWIFLFFSAYKVLFTVLPAITILPLQWKAGQAPKRIRMNKDLMTAILRALSAATLIDYNPGTKRLKATRRTEDLAAFLEDLETEDEEHDKQEPVFSSYLQAWHLFVLFAAFYWDSCIKGSGHWMLTPPIFLLCLLILIGYVVGMQFYHSLIEKREEILFLIQGMQLDAKVEAALQKQRCAVNEQTSPEGNTYTRTFQYRQQQYHLFFCWVRGELTLPVLDAILKTKVQEGQRVVLLTNGNLGTGVKERVVAMNDLLRLLVIRNVEDLALVLGEAFPNERPLNILF